jgi:hypothetical protein
MAAKSPPRSYTRFAAPLVIGALVLTGVVVAATYVDTGSTATTSTTLSKTFAKTTTITESPSGLCLSEVQQGAVFSSYDNGASQGYSVTYSNGTEDLFPLNSCPVPVTPENYQIDSTIEANPKFIAAENGSTYEANNACNCSYGGNTNNSTGQYASPNFDLYGNQKIYPCGNDSYWTFNRLGLILVIIPINSTGGLDFSNLEIQSLPGNPFFGCTTTTAQSTSLSTRYSASSTNSTEGLQLILILNSTSIWSGGVITAQIEVLNTLDHNVTLASGPMWNQTIPALNGTMYSLNAYDYVCSDNPDYYFANFVLFKGHYSAGNISLARSPLQEGPPVRPPCAGNANTPFPVTFLPNGDEVAVSQPGYIPLNLTAEVSANTLYCAESGLAGNSGGIYCRYGDGLVGYWNSSAYSAGGFASPGFTYFPPGEYTIVAFDAWNQYSYATFTVSTVPPFS